MKSFIFSLMGAFLFSSCALQMWKVKTEELTPYPEFTRFTVMKEVARPIVIESIEDARTEKDKLGIVKTGVQYKDTPVYLEGDLAEYLKLNWTDELKRRGISLPPEDADYALKIVLEKLWVKEKIGDDGIEQAECEVGYSFELNALKEKLPSWAGTVSGRFISPGDKSDATTKVAPTLATCFSIVVEKLMNDPKFQKTLSYN